MGFPRDTLSVAILAFARFFSLPISPELMKNLRREILMSGKASVPGTSGEKNALEAEVLTRLAAEDKGVVLSAEALKHYAGFFGGEAEDSPQKKEKKQGREEDPSAEELKAEAEEQAQNDGLFNFLNLIPGKNGQYWTVYPLNITIRGIELKVLIRILNNGSISQGETGRMIIDISSPKRQWRFFLKESAGKNRTEMRVHPSLDASALGSLQKEAKHFLWEEITVRNEEDGFFLVDDICNESLPYINKEV